MYFHFINQLILLLPLFNDNTTSKDTLNSTWWDEGEENLTALWDWDMQMKEDLHILPGNPDIRSEFPVCCDLNSGVKTFQCDSKIVKRNNVISILSQTLTQNSQPGANSTRERFYWNVPECPSSRNKFVILDVKSIENQNRTRFLRNGYFGYNNEFYSPQEYCINGLTGEFVEVKICEPECSKERPCINLCCDPDEIYSFKKRKCLKSNSTLYSPIFYHDMSNKVGEQEGTSLPRPHFTIKFPRTFKYYCQENITQIFPSGNLFADYLSNSTGRKYFPADFHIRKDGVVMYRKDGKAILLSDGHPIFLKENNRKCYTLKTEHYCIDGAVDFGSPLDFSNEEGQTFLVTCSEHLYQPPIIGPLSFLYGNVMIGSSFFSFLTVLVYLTLKEKRNIHGLTVVSYASSMFFMYIFLGLAHLIRYYGSDEVLKSTPCVAIGIASHLFSLSSFLWLTMMNVGHWWTFRKIRPIVRLDYQLQQTKLWNQYLKYSIFGWGIPILSVAVSTVIHFNYETPVEDDCADIALPLPAYGRESCEIKQLSLGVYLYFPASALLLCNLIFFVVTTYSLCKHETTTLVAVKRIQERQHQSIQLFGKLFFTMGVTRIFELITWYESGPLLTWYWAVFDIFNILQAVAIFIIYVCKRDVVRALKNKMPKFIHRPKDSFRFKNENTGYEDTFSKH